MLRYPLSSEQCEILVAFDSLGTAFALADHFHKDVSVISRQLKRIAETAPVLEKLQGKWRLTPTGKQVVAWARESMGRLSLIIEQRPVLRIGTTREFASRVLCPQLAELKRDIFDGVDLSIITGETGVEELLLGGEIDLGFDCGRPFEPLIRYRHARKESFGVFASPGFVRAHGPIKTFDRLLELPNLQYRRVSLAKYLGLSTEVSHTAARFNDLAAMREACVAGVGWTVLPLYTVARELEQRSLVRLPAPRTLTSDHFGVWWLREASGLEGILRKAETWLRAQDTL